MAIGATQLPTFNPTGPNYAVDPQNLQRMALMQQMAGQPGPETVAPGSPQSHGDTTAPGWAGTGPTDPANGPTQSPGSTTENTKVEQNPDGSTTTTTGSKKGGTNVDTFMGLLNDPKYKDDPQAAVDAFNALGLDGDGTKLSSHYGSSPAVYDNGKTIGLPDRYMTKNSDGTWTTVMRGSAEDTKTNAGGDGGGGSAASSIASLPGLDLSQVNPNNQDQFIQGLMNYARQLILQGSTLPQYQGMQKGALLSSMGNNTQPGGNLSTPGSFANTNG